MKSCRGGPAEQGAAADGDAGHFFACAVEAKADIPFAVLYATSKTPRQPYDLATAKELIGFEPQESWPQGIEVVLG